MDNETLNLIRIMRENGATVREIYNTTGIRETTIFEVLRANGIVQGHRSEINDTMPKVKWLDRMNDWGRLVNVYNADGTKKGVKRK